MATASSDLSFRSYLRRLPLEMLRMLLQAMGLWKPKRRRPGMYWARDELGRWELRVPARSLHEGPPA